MHDPNDDRAPYKMIQTIGLCVGAAVAYIIIVLGLMFYCKKRRNAKRLQKGQDGEEPEMECLNGMSVGNQWVLPKRSQPLVVVERLVYLLPSCGCPGYSDSRVTYPKMMNGLFERTCDIYPWTSDPVGCAVCQEGHCNRMATPLQRSRKR